MTQPLVSVIVTTLNNSATLEACLASIGAQTYTAVELIVVDNRSTDNTVAIAKQYTPHVYKQGPERSAQRNFGVGLARGEYVLIVDSDMELRPNVIAACVHKALANPQLRGAIIPEDSFGKGFWAQCKRLERSYYEGNDTIEAARFFGTQTYLDVGGYDETMTGGEDWDLTRRVRAVGPIGRVTARIGHNEGQPRFGRTVRKMYYYGKHAGAYFAKNPGPVVTNQSGPLARYKLFFSRPRKLLRNPVLSAGMLLLKTSEFAAGGLGYLAGQRSSPATNGPEVRFPGAIATESENRE
jgi:glycosyltransferase involved in cell wall biosynthesis